MRLHKISHWATSKAEVFFDLAISANAKLDFLSNNLLAMSLSQSISVNDALSSFDFYFHTALLTLWSRLRTWTRCP